KNARSPDSRPDAEPNEPQRGAPPPDDAMQRRMLNAGQVTAAKSRKIKIDEWAGSFDGQIRKKLELAIEDFLKRLDTALAEAEKSTLVLTEHFRTAETWDDAQVKLLRGARGQLDEAGRVVVDLTSKSAGTPYAFIGLQLTEIFESHVAVAAERLD